MDKETKKVLGDSLYSILGLVAIIVFTLALIRHWPTNQLIFWGFSGTWTLMIVIDRSKE